jgi:hypothetical protein
VGRGLFSVEYGVVSACLPARGLPRPWAVPRGPRAWARAARVGRAVGPRRENGFLYLAIVEILCNLVFEANFEEFLRLA